MENEMDDSLSQTRIDVAVNTKENRIKMEDVKASVKNNDENENNRTFHSVIQKKQLIAILAHFAVLVFTGTAINHWYYTGQKPIKFSEGIGLYLLVTSLFYLYLFYCKILKPSVVAIPTKFVDCYSCPALLIRFYRKVPVLYIVPPMAFAIFLAYDTQNDRKRLIGLLGTVATYLIGFVFSKHPTKVRWDIIYRGTVIQIIIALCTVRWTAGRQLFENIGNKIERFLSFSYVGAAFVYSDNLVYNQTVFAFQCLSVIFFIGFLVEILFYWTVLQRMFASIGCTLQKAIGTTPIETINSCVSCFLGMNEALLVIKPYMKDLTQSELLAVLLGGLSTVAGSVFAAYASFGVQPKYLVTASLMSAPAALALSKLLYPETEKSKTNATCLEVDNSFKHKYSSALSAGCAGAISGGPIIAAIIASLITFISLVASADAILTWLGELIGFSDVTIVTLLTPVFTPIAFLIGIDASQSKYVGELIATKAILNEFVAYKKLGEFKKMNLLTAKTEAVATYALCSFSNPGSVASLIALISTLCPERVSDTTTLIFRAYVGGIVTCFITASLAGVLTPSDDLFTTFIASNNTNSTVLTLLR